MKGLRAVQTALVALGLAGAATGSAQVALAPGQTYSQDFNSLANTGTTNAFADNSTLLGWYSARAGGTGGPGANTVYLAGNGGTTNGGVYSFGSTGSSERALGALPTNALGVFCHGLRVQNASSSAIPGFQLSYTGEQWRNGGVVTANTLTIEYRIVAAGTTFDLGCNTSTDWSSVSALTFTSPTTSTTAAALDGNASANRAELSAALGAPLMPGQELWIRWTDINEAGNDHGLALDDVTLAASPTAAPVLDIAAASEFEGNSGQTPLNFALTLSSAAPAGGLRVLATTSNGTATAGDDYVALTDAEFTIAAGATTANVVVQILGDTTDEPDETLTVSLTLPDGGATFGDSAGSAIGTIRNDDASSAVLSIAPAADVAEGNTGTTPQVFVASLSGPLPTDVSLTASTADISATAGQDYVAFSDRPFVIAAGQTSVEIAVDVIGDRVDEANESYRVSIASSSPGVTLGTATAEGVILDDDLPFTEIFSIQGNGVCSPFVTPCNIAANVTGEPVRTQANVVTAVGTAGFTMQTPDARDDGDASTSNGIYVFTSVAPRNDAGELLAVGDQVEVVGRAAEFFSMTQIVVNSTRDTANSILTQASNQTLPTAIVFGEAPTRGSVLIPSKDPDNLSCGALGNFECFEGMRVSIPNGAVTVANQRRAAKLYAETWISPYGERGVREKGALPGTVLTPDNAAAGVWDGNPEIIEFDADFLSAPTSPGVELAGGTRFSATGVIGYDFGDYEFWASELTIVDGTNEAVRPVPAASEGELTIGSFNAFRLCDAVRDNPPPSTVLCAATAALETDPNRVTHQLGQVSAYIRQVLLSPDVIGMQEVENLGILEALATQIAADGGPTYSAHLVEGNDVGGIDVGYLVNTARVTGITVTQLADAETWNDPGGSATATLHDRPPLLLAADFIGNGRPFRFHVINNHTRSRGGVDVSDANGERIRAKRYLQAVSIANLVQDLQTDEATADVPLFVIGDHNAFQFTDGYVDVVGLIAGTYVNAENTCAPANQVTTCKLPGGANIVVPALVNAVDVIDEDERYSYKFTEDFGPIQGSTGRDLATNQVLDHGLFNSVAAPYVTGMAFGRANVDASTQRFRTCNYTLRDATFCPQGPGSWVPTGSSDHDGFVLFVSPPLPDAIFANGFETID